MARGKTSARGDLSDLRNLSDTLKRIAKDQKKMAETIAILVAPALTEIGREDYDASRFPSGDSWALSKTGHRVTLVKSGIMRRFMVYKPLGDKIRVSLNTDYAPYQLGKRSPFPRYYAPLPDKYKQAINAAFLAVLGKDFGVYVTRDR